MGARYIGKHRPETAPIYAMRWYVRQQLGRRQNGRAAYDLWVDYYHWYREAMTR